MGDPADSHGAEARASSREEREAFLELASRFTPFVAADCDDATFIVSTSGEKVGRSLFSARRRGEMSTLDRAVQVIRRLLGEGTLAGTTFLDVGANIGTSTVTALRSHAFSSAVACEPHPDNFRLLRFNAIINDLDDVVEALPVAVSNKPGTARLAVSRVNSGAHHVVTSPGPMPGRTIEVEQVTLDGLAERNIVVPAQTGFLRRDRRAGARGPRACGGQEPRGARHPDRHRASRDDARGVGWAGSRDERDPRPLHPLRGLA